MNYSHIGIAETNYDEVEKIWSGKKRKDFYGSDVTIGEVAHFMLSAMPEKIIQVMDPTGEELTAAQLLRNSKLIAKCLLGMGLKAGDVIGISASYTTHVIAVMLAGFFCGMPTNSLYPEFNRETVVDILKVTKPSILFCDVKNYATIKEAVKSVGLEADIFVLNGELAAVRCVRELLEDDGSAIDFDSLPCRHLSGNDTAVIVCTSGTTGPPKGVLCSHRALLNQRVLSNIKSDWVLLTFSPMYWISGIFIIVAALTNGTKRIITNKPFAPDYYEELVEKYRVTHAISGPYDMVRVMQQATLMTAKRLQSISCIVCGGAKVPQVLMQKFNEIFGNRLRGAGLTEAYGLSELAGLLSENDAGFGKRREGSVGKLMPNMEVQIIDHETSQLMGPNGQGIIHIRTPYKWAGYYNNPDGTKNAYKKGWLSTNDVGYFDDDGFLYIVARESDIFRSWGFDISPPHIEDIVMKISGVLEVCVFGMPDVVATYLTSCGIVRAQNEYGQSLTAEQIKQFVAKKMPPMYQIQGEVYFVEALPKTATGKIKRNMMLDMIKTNHTEPSDETKNWVKLYTREKK